MSAEPDRQGKYRLARHDEGRVNSNNRERGMTNRSDNPFRPTSRTRARQLATGLAGTLLVTACMLAPGTSFAQKQAGSDTAMAPQGTPDAQMTFFLIDPASSGTGLLGRGTIMYKGQSYRFDATGARLSRTAADAPPSIVGSVYKLNGLSDVSGTYVSFGDRAAGLHFLRNKAGVVVELGNGIGSGKLRFRDAANPITIKLIDAAAP